MALVRVTRSLNPSRGAGQAFGFGATPLGPDALAQAAWAIYQALPPGSGVNPITPAMNAAAGSSEVVDTVWGGTRAVPYYWAHPIPDPSGLILWTGSDSSDIPPGLTAAQLLARQVLLAGGDTSFSADFHPQNDLQYTSPVNTQANVVQQYTAPTSYTVVQAPPPVDPLGGLTSAQYDEYLRTHGGWAPGTNPNPTTISQTQFGPVSQAPTLADVNAGSTGGGGTASGLSMPSAGSGASVDTIGGGATAEVPHDHSSLMLIGLGLVGLLFISGKKARR